MGLSCLDRTPLTTTLRVLTEATSESESEGLESWLTEWTLPFRSQISEPFQWFILPQTLHLLPHAGHSSFFIRWIFKQNLHLSFRDWELLLSGKCSGRSLRLPLVFGGPFALLIQWTSSSFPPIACIWVVAPSEVRQISIHFFRSSFLSWSRRLRASSFLIPRTMRSRIRESFIVGHVQKLHVSVMFLRAVR